MNCLRSFLCLCVFLAAACPGAAAAAPAPGEVHVAVYAPDGSERWSTGLADLDADQPEGALTALPWHKQLPDLDVRLIGGGVVPLAESRGSVVILEFWATWCAPCRRALPKLQSLYEAHRDEGLTAIAINVGESPHLALPYAEDMGLTMPIGIYQEAMVPTLFGQAVPTMVIADRMGNIRGRWDTYTEEQDAEVAALIERLLGEKAERPREIASVLRGGGLFRLEWMRQVATTVDDLLVTQGPNGGISILVSHGRLLAYHLPDGQTEKQWAGDRAAGKIRPTPPDAGSSHVAASFRPGRPAIVLLSGPGGEKKKIDLEAHVFDLAWWPAQEAGDGPRLVAATLEGLLVLDENGEIVLRPEGFGAVSALARIGSGPSSQLIVLETSGRLSWVDRTFERLHEVETLPESWALWADEDTVVVASGEVAAVVVGEFFGGGEQQVAVATRPDRLRVLTAATGEVLFEAEWEGITALAAGDLDGDGVDELVVGEGKSMGILTQDDR